MRFQQIYVQHKYPNDVIPHGEHHDQHGKLVEKYEIVWPKIKKMKSNIDSYG